MRYATSLTTDGTEFEVGWDGVPLGTKPYLAFDTETEVVDLSRQVPRLATLQVSNGRRHVIVHPDDVDRLVTAHRGAIWVGHNVAFDWPVVRKAVWITSGDQKGRFSERLEAHKEWDEVLHTNRLRDTMLFDFLVRLTDPTALVTHLRGLGEVAKGWLKREDVDKQSPYRLRFGELIGADWSAVDPGFWEYAIKDVIVTHAAYNKMFVDMLVRGLTGPSHVHGPLTECLQARAAVVLGEIGRNGFALDASQVTETKARLKALIDVKASELEGMAPGLFRRYKVRTKTAQAGDLMTNRASGVPLMDMGVLRDHLVRVVAEEAEADVASIPRTKKTYALSTALEPWQSACGHHPFVVTWVELANASKLHQFLVQLAGKDVVHAGYRPLVRTGRTSCTKPNVQQMPREPWLRALFVARPGHKLVIVDYSAIELVTLGAVLTNRFGTSVLADQLRAGRDPHAFTAAMIKEVTYEEFLGWKKGTDREQADFKAARQAAKAVNFGVPGGLGPAKLALYAKANYGVEMSKEEASRLRKKLTTEVYPELALYLDEDMPARLAGAFGRPKEEVVEVFTRHLGTAPSWNFWFSFDQIVEGRAKQSNGNTFPAPTRNAVWGGLAELTKGTDHHAACRDGKGSVKLWKSLGLGATAVTLTGRARAGLIYTEARNTPFQGLAADGAKVALYRLWRAGYKIVAFVHDEIVCEVAEDRAEVERLAIEAIMIDSMASVLGCDIPVKVEGKVSARWEK